MRSFVAYSRPTGFAEFKEVGPGVEWDNGTVSILVDGYINPFSYPSMRAMCSALFIDRVDRPDLEGASDAS